MMLSLLEITERNLYNLKLKKRNKVKKGRY